MQFLLTNNRKLKLIDVKGKVKMSLSPGDLLSFLYNPYTIFLIIGRVLLLPSLVYIFEFSSDIVLKIFHPGSSQADNIRS